jgi:hypothetical protein
MEPPPLATWMLEHLTPAGRDDALAGDLLEVFRSGRSSGWYWRQVIAACAVAWFRSLRTRLPLLVFAIVWSALAPAWVAVVAGVCNRPLIASTLHSQWPLAAAAWIVPNSVFLWTGMLIYIAAHADFRRKLRGPKVIRAFLLAPLLFLPAYAATFILSNLLWYPGLGGYAHNFTPLAAVVNLHVWANAMRIPYLVAFVAALWGAIPETLQTRNPQFAGHTDISAQSASMGLVSNLDTFTVSRFFTLTVTAGLVNAMIMSFALLRLPESHSPSISSLCIRAIFYVFIGALAGVGGSWFYWNNASSPFRKNPPLPFPLFALVCAAAWVWIPSMVLFYEQVSAATAFVAVAGAFALASGLRSATRSLFAPASHAPSLWEYNHAGLFAESLYRPPFDARGCGIAVALYAAGWALTTHSNYIAALLLASSAFLFAWERTAPLDRPYESGQEYRQSALRLAKTALPAILLTMWALLDGVAQREHALVALAAAQRPDPAAAKQKDRASTGAGFSGYESIILWPVPEKKQIVAPLPPGMSLLAKGQKQPLVLQFTGAYWYFQPPDKQPGPRALQTHGTPIQENIRSSNMLPLLMEAHQNLGAPVHLARCGEVQVAIENHDATTGPVAMALLLADSNAAGRPTLYLGQQQIVSSEPGQLTAQSVPAHETLRFFLPAHADVHQFDGITVIFFPEMGTFRTAPRIAIDQFTLIPR